MVAKQVRAAYTQEFRLEAVRLVQSGQSQVQVCQTLGIPKAGLGSWVRQVKTGTLKFGVTDGATSKVTPEQMELARLRTENARLRMERDIAKKAAAHFAQDVLESVTDDGDYETLPVYKAVIKRGSIPPHPSTQECSNSRGGRL